MSGALVEYTKPYQSFEELADKVQGRGLGGDRETLLFSLQTIGYYRLSGYWHIFHKDDVFFEGATIEKVLHVYNFDRQFRLIVLNALEHIEIYFRTQLAHKLSRDHGAFGYLDAATLPRLKGNKHTDFIAKCHGSFERSREPFVLHYQDKYGEGDKTVLPPIWTMVNVMDFGQIVTMYKGASVAIRQEIAAEFGVSARVLESWLLSLNTVRNVCAHHGRLWNKVLGTQPAIPKTPEWDYSCRKKPDRIFTILVIMQYLTRTISPNSSWRTRFEELLEKYPYISIQSMGFPQDWEKCEIWKLSEQKPKGTA